MSTLVKRVVALAVAKKGYDYIHEKRRPQRRSKAALALPLVAAVAAVGYTAFRAYSARQAGQVATGTAPERSDAVSGDDSIRLDDTLSGTNR